MDDKNDQQWKWVGKTVNHVTPLQLRTIWGRICVRFCYNFSVRFWRLHCVNALYFVIADALFSLPSFFFFLFHFSTEIFARFSSIETSAIGLKLWHCAEWHQFNNRPFRYASPCLWNHTLSITLTTTTLYDVTVCPYIVHFSATDAIGYRYVNVGRLLNMRRVYNTCYAKACLSWRLYAYRLC